MDIIFLVLILSGIIIAAVTGNISSVMNAIVDSANDAVDKIFGFMGIMTFWLGIAKIAQKSGFLESMACLVRPILCKLFPGVPREHPGMGAILMNLCANIMGFGSAATPFGLKAMEELQKLNNKKDTATDAMCTFLALNTASVTLIPATVIAFRAAAGSNNPAEIIGTTVFATICSSITAITLDYVLRKYNRRNKR